MILQALLEAIGHAMPIRAAGPGEADRRAVSGIVCDSRQVVPGSVFVALKGQRHDGLGFVPQAVAAGAAAVVAESEPPAGTHVPWIAVPDARLALALLAAAFHEHPSGRMLVVGITGTNGKTTTAYLVASIFEGAGIRCGRLGTVTYRIGDAEQDAGRTTPEAPDVQRLFREMVEARCGACAIEVSSHALALRRVDGTKFAAGIFTNLTRDHLDFHGDMEGYFLAKRRLFEMLPGQAPAVVNVDDPKGPALAGMVRRPVTYAIDHPADVTPGPIASSLDGLSFGLRTPRGRLQVRSRLFGRPNAYNILAAASAAMALDLPFSAIEAGIAGLEMVPGRFQIVSDRADDVTVVVDYAHTDDALKNALETARPLAQRRLITVFGCGGDRDRQKRPLMGAVAARLSDMVVLTSDNPRSEDPLRIIEEIQRGMPPAERSRPRNGAAAAPRALECLRVSDRAEAIERAVRLAAEGDFVLIAGKGHEKHQELGGRAVPFDDVEVARAALARRRSGSRVS